MNRRPIPARTAKRREVSVALGAGDEPFKIIEVKRVERPQHFAADALGGEPEWQAEDPLRTSCRTMHHVRRLVSSVRLAHVVTRSARRTRCLVIGSTHDRSCRAAGHSTSTSRTSELSGAADIAVLVLLFLSPARSTLSGQTASAAMHELHQHGDGRSERRPSPRAGTCPSDCSAGPARLADQRGCAHHRG